MASLELIDHTQDLKSWHLPQQQHGVRQPPQTSPSDDDDEIEPPEAAISGE